MTTRIFSEQEMNEMNNGIAPQTVSIVDYILAVYPSSNGVFTEALQLADAAGDILTYTDVLDFLAWWAFRDDFRMNIFKDSWFGVVQQYRGLLNAEESEYINHRSAGWVGSLVSLRTVLNDLRRNFAPA